LFGLSAFVIEQRIKEIGIRKVLGASVREIIYLLSKDFSKWVILSNLIAWPLAWILLSKWLQNFAYRIELSWWIFLISGAVALIIALLTVSTQAVKVAFRNPVEVLKYE
jgi:putative ABC transport system permease protein